MSEFKSPAVSQPGAGLVINAFGKNTVRISADQTAGALSILEVSMPAGEGTPMHIHELEDETFRVISGRFAFWCGESYVELDKGGIISLPRGIAHKFKNIGMAEGELMVTLTPGGFESFFSRCENADPQSEAEIFRIAEEFKLSFVDP